MDLETGRQKLKDLNGKSMVSPINSFSFPFLKSRGSPWFQVSSHLIPQDISQQKKIVKYHTLK